MTDNSAEDMDHQTTDAGVPQGAHAMVKDHSNSDTEGEKQQESKAGTEEKVESDGASSQEGDEGAAAPSGTGLLKPNVEIQP